MGGVNISSAAPYAQINAGISHKFAMPDGKPVTVRFAVVNLRTRSIRSEAAPVSTCSPAIWAASRLLLRRVEEALTVERTAHDTKEAKGRSRASLAVFNRRRVLQQPLQVGPRRSLCAIDGRPPHAPGGVP
jgi:hypothetical protein